MWDTAKAVLRGKFVSMNVHIRIEERSKIYNLSFYFRKLEKENQITLKVSRITFLCGDRKYAGTL